VLTAVAVSFHCDVISCDLARRGVRRGETACKHDKKQRMMSGSIGVASGGWRDPLDVDLPIEGNIAVFIDKVTKIRLRNTFYTVSQKTRHQTVAHNFTKY